MDEVITFRLNSRVKAAVEAKISTSIEEWLVNKCRTMVVYDELARLKVGRSDEQEEEKRIEAIEAVDAEKQRLIAELEA